MGCRRGRWRRRLQVELLLLFQISINLDEHQTLTGGNGKRDRGAEDIAILAAGTCTFRILGAMFYFKCFLLTWISATIGLGFTSAVIRTVIGAKDLAGS